MNTAASRRPLAIDVDSEEIAKKKRRRARDTQTVVIPFLRVVGNALLAVAVYLHNRFLLGNFFRALTGICGRWVLANLIGLIRQLPLLIVDIFRALLSTSNLLLDISGGLIVVVAGIIQQAVRLLHRTLGLLLSLLLLLGIAALLRLTHALRRLLKTARCVCQLRIVLLSGLLLQLARQLFQIPAQLLDVSLIVGRILLIRTLLPL